MFTRVQQRVLGILFANPGRSYPATELIALAGVGTGAVHRELGRLVEADLVTVTPVGKQRRYQANGESPIFPELHGLIQKTVGLVEPLRQALGPLSARIQLSFVYGSAAEGQDSATSEIDLMVVADDLSYPEVLSAAREAERSLGKCVRPSLLTVEEWKAQERGEGPVAAPVGVQPKLVIVGGKGHLG